MSTLLFALNWILGGLGLGNDFTQPSASTRFGARVGLAILDKKDIPETRLEFANSLPTYIPPEPFRWIGAQITMYALDTVDQKGGWRKLWLAMVEKMGFPVTQ